MVNKLIPKSNKSHPLGLMIKTLIMFGTVFSIHPKWRLPSVFTLRIIIMLLCIFYVLFKGIQERKTFSINLKLKNFSFAGVSLFVFLYSFMLVKLNKVTSEFTMTSSAFNYFIFIGIFAYFAKVIFNSSKEFCGCVLNAAFIQAVIVLLGLLIPQVRTFLDQMQSFGNENSMFQDYRYTWRIIGLGIAGAGGSVYLFTGMIAAGWLKITGNLSKFQLIQMSLLSIAILLVGRTGFYTSLSLWGYLIYDDIRYKKGSLKTLGLLLFLLLLFILILVIFNNLEGVNDDLISYTLVRSAELFFGGTKVISQIIDIPPLRMETIIGTGITRGSISSSIYIWSDSGYIQRYAGIGLIMATISYFSYVFEVIRYAKNLSRSNFNFFIFILLLLLIIEIKEPFFYQLAYPFVLLVLVRLVTNEKCTSC